MFIGLGSEIAGGTIINGDFTGKAMNQQLKGAVYNFLTMEKIL
jgi:hypothetical protein